ncbi:YqiJ family protein [Sphingomonas hengshuiensis]|uniref:DUF1449 domain-containing protein n=1 Tax=Sphingomonas hengshuiensis TaxID=1609977 RepID=A0A7U5BEQ3_9SPHN|nr:YqiJ family protein [Sphingomonas hengshuiensis]AJP70865.1 hypothetical protein TS85_02080 [Sphingomonas hengshuiensis]
MLSFLAAPENILFVSALVLMLLIGAVQLIGFGFDTDIADGPDIDSPDGDLDLLAWLGVGRLPLLMLIVVFLTIFGVLGLIGQQLSHDLLGALVSPWIAAPAAFAATLPLTGLAAAGLARILPRDHTTAIDLELLAGREAIVVTGRAILGSPARARVQDHHGQAHYVMVEPDRAGPAFEEGEAVLLVRREGDVFRAISRGDFRLPRLEV